MRKQYNPREAEKLLKNNGFIAIRTNGSHRVYSNGKRSVCIPIVKLNPMLFRRIIKENNLVWLFYWFLDLFII